MFSNFSIFSPTTIFHLLPRTFSLTLVGIRTGPFTLRFFSFAPLIRSAHTFSRDFTLRLVRVILIRWMATSGSTGVLPVSLKACYHTSENKKLLRSLSNPGTSALGASQFLAASRKPIPWRNESRSLPPAQSTSKTRPGSPRLTMAAVWLPDRLVPRRERTAVSQEQERAAHTAAATATASSSKRKAWGLWGAYIAALAFASGSRAPLCAAPEEESSGGL